MLLGAAPALEAQEEVTFLRAYTSFTEGKVVCEWEAPAKDKVASAYTKLGFPFDSIHEVEAICDNGDGGVDTRFL